MIYQHKKEKHTAWSIFRIDKAEQTKLTGQPDAENSLGNSNNVVPVASVFKAGKNFDYQPLTMSLTVIRIKTTNGVASLNPSTKMKMK